ncbi:hypothetical protein HDU84_003373 [Entophlyctis sp. JEL0112]|nr:hypothetical protein HDU84_003373 [Entophlyctis sp. JEL0112]
MSTSTTLRSVALAKMALHAAKFPALSVLGVLLSPSSSADIADAVPVIHDLLPLASVLQAALQQIQIYSSRSNYKIVGVYVANQSLDDISIKPLTAAFANAVSKISGGDPIDNKALLKSASELGILTFKEANGAWKQSSNRPQIVAFLNSRATLDGDVSKLHEKLSSLIAKDLQVDIHDFVNHLDDAAVDWLVNERVLQALNG